MSSRTRGTQRTRKFTRRQISGEPGTRRERRSTGTRYAGVEQCTLRECSVVDIQHVEPDSSQVSSVMKGRFRICCVVE